MGIGFPPHHVVPHDIEIPEAPNFLAEPACLGVEPLHFRALQHGTIDGKHAAQAAQANPQLVRTFHVVQLPDHQDIRGDLIEAFAQDVARGLLGGLSRIKRNVLGIAGRQRQVDPPLFRKKIAARGLGKAGEPQASIGNQRVRNVE